MAATVEGLPMSKSWLRFAELTSLVLIAGGLIGLAAYMVAMNRMGEAFGTVLTTIPLVVQAIRNIGQAQAMNAMAEALGKSAPVQTQEDTNV